MRKCLGVTTYSGAHNRLNITRGLATGYVCLCGVQAAEWAYTHDDPCLNERADQRGQKFSLDTSKYKPLCRRCHRLYDKEHIVKCPKGHEYTPDNTIIDAGKRKCKTCVYARNHRRPLTPAQRARKTQLQRDRRAREQLIQHLTRNEETYA